MRHADPVGLVRVERHDHYTPRAIRAKMQSGGLIRAGNCPENPQRRRCHPRHRSSLTRPPLATCELSHLGTTQSDTLQTDRPLGVELRHRPRGRDGDLLRHHAPARDVRDARRSAERAGDGGGARREVDERHPWRRAATRRVRRLSTGEVTWGPAAGAPGMPSPSRTASGSARGMLGWATRIASLWWS